MWTDVHAFHRHLAELSRQSLRQRTAELEASDAPEDHKKPQLHRLTQYAAAWGASGRVICLSAVADPTGRQIADPHEACQHLAQYWGQVHGEGGLDRYPIEECDQLRPFAPQLPNLVNWILEPEEFQPLVEKPRMLVLVLMGSLTVPMLKLVPRPFGFFIEFIKPFSREISGIVASTRPLVFSLRKVSAPRMPSRLSEPFPVRGR
eukprot:1816000-Pyramimonas_sp.AAC.1